MSVQKPSGYRILPLRDHNDMIVKAKFVVPDIKDSEKLVTRMKINLLYYQTNYFLFFIIWPYAFGFLFPDYFLYGMGAVLVLPLTLLVLEADNIRPSTVTPQMIALCFGAAWAIVTFATGLITSVLYFILAIGLPLTVIIAHASARYNTRQDTFHFHQSPMGKLLGFRSAVYVTQKVRVVPPPEYEHIRSSTLPRRSNSGS